MHRYMDAARVFNTVLAYINRVKQYHARSVQYEQVCVCVCVTVCVTVCVSTVCSLSRYVCLLCCWACACAC